MRRSYIHFLTVLSALLYLSGCTTPKGLERRSERLKIAQEKKGVLIPKDTIYSSDTIISRIAIGDTVYITKTVTVTLEPIVEYKTNKVVKWETKYQTKWKYKTLKVKEKAKIKKVRIENCGWWCKVKIFLFGVVVGFLLYWLKKLYGKSIREISKRF